MNRHAVVSDSGVLPGKIPGQFFRMVLGGIVYNEKFKSGMTLLQDGPDRCLQKIRRLIGGKHHADPNRLQDTAPHFPEKRPA